MRAASLRPTLSSSPFLVLLAICLALAGCGGGGKLAPVTNITAGQTGPGEKHTVRKGESVYAIAWRYGMDYKDIARWNALGPPYLIYPGQTLLLTGPVLAKADARPAAPVKSAPRPTSPAKPAKRPPKPAKPITGSKPAKPPEKPKATSPPRPKVAVASAPPASRTASRNIDNNKMTAWIWPTKGKVRGTFGKGGGKGIDIEGRRGQDINAAHAGEVVYAGGGLIGYGELIIVKHNKRFLSAYAHNSAILVKEGDLVERGQTIARMGSSGTDRVRLHFEIRRDGKPVNPLRYLPR